MNLPKKDPTEVITPKTKKPLFPEPKPGETQFLLLPQDEKEYQGVLELLAKEPDLVEDSLPKLRREVVLKKLGPNHTVFVGVRTPTKISPLTKQPSEFKLKISPAVRCKDFVTSTEEDDVLDETKFVDELNKHARPLRVAISNDRHAKLLWM